MTTEPRLRSQVLLFWTFAVALPVAVLLNVEIWSQTSYTGGTFHLDGFRYLYQNGIYRYRLLGPELLLATYRGLLHVVPHSRVNMPHDPDADLPFVLAYAALNGACLMLTNVILLGLMWRRHKGFRFEDLPLYLFTFLLLTVSMSVVTPYDQLAYLLLLVGVGGAWVRNAALAYGLVAVSAVAGMLNRETEFLLTCLFVTVAVFTRGKISARFWGLSVTHLGLCGAVYAGLRLAIPGEASVAGLRTYGGPWAVPALVVLCALFGAAVVMAQVIFEGTRPALLFLGLSVPYLLTIFVAGVLRELRLVVPMILCVFCLYLLLRRAGQGDEGAA